MSKLYEALQEAKRDKLTKREPTLVEPPRVEATTTLGFETEMRALYRSLDNIFPGLNQKVILLLGLKGGEGTSTVVSRLARVAAHHFNREVAVLDADTLSPRQHQLFGVSPTVGWDDVLRGTEPAEKVYYETNGDLLHVIPVATASAGTVPDINAPGLDGFFGAIRERFDLVFIDCAPAMVCPDSITLSRKVDGVVLVIEAESTRWPVVQNIHQQIENTGGTVIGIVFNKRRYYIPEFVYKKL